MKKKKAIPVIVFVFSCICVFLFFAFLWARFRWGSLTIDEILYELNAPLEGTSSSIILSFIRTSVIPTVLVITAMLACAAFIRKKGIVLKHYSPVAFVLSLALLCGTAYAAWHHFEVGSYLKGVVSDSSYIEDHYVDPADVAITFPEKKRNLIYIFLESMELSYTDKEHGGAFDEDHIPGLTKLSLENENFSGHSSVLNGGHSMYGSTYTMGAMVANTSGLPLQMDLAHEDMEDFYPGVTTLGDILHDQGYVQEFFIGSAGVFGGRRLYVSQHGDYITKDYDYQKEAGRIPPDYYVWWGFEDEKLFEFAKEELLDLAAGDEPFNFTMLTVDTHTIGGYVCRLCKDEYPLPYRNVVACSGRQVTEFVNWIKEQDFYENTTVVLVGDHPTMDPSVWKDTPSDYDHRVYTAFLNAAAEPEDPGRARTYTTMDFFPTTLAALGCKIEGERLGLGTNLYSSRDTLLEESNVEKMNAELVGSYQYLARLTNTANPQTKFNRELSFRKFYDKSTDTLFISMNADIADNDDRPKIDITVSDNEGHSQTVTGYKKHDNMTLYGEIDLSGMSDELHISIDYRSEKENMQIRSIDKTKEELLAERDLFSFSDYIKNRDAALIAVAQNDTSAGLTDEIGSCLAEMGLDTDLLSKSRNSYYAVLDGDSKAEEASEDALSYETTLSSGRKLSLFSRGYLAGERCGIDIDGIEVSENSDGLNLVALDEKSGELIGASNMNLSHEISADIDVYGYSPENESLPVALYNIKNDDVAIIAAHVRYTDSEHTDEWRSMPLFAYEASEGTFTANLDLSGLDPEDIIIQMFFTDEDCTSYLAGVLEGDVT